ncbi:hypothetical protein ABPG75_004206 [Micractinium tetrahymenae]
MASDGSRAGMALLAAALLAVVASSAPAAADLSTENIYAPTNAGLKPQRLQTFGRMHYYQLADNPRGTLVTFHGCGRSARAFFPYDPDNCPECLGFPEHVAHTKQALALGYSLLAMEPQDNRHLCWSSSEQGYFVDDRSKVVMTITKFLIEQGLTQLPVYLLGTSSGGTMVLKQMQTVEELARKNGVDLVKEPQEGDPFVLRIAGIISEESVPDPFPAEDDGGGLKYPSQPPTIFIAMERGKSLGNAPRVVDFLRSHGVPSGFIESPIRRVVPTFLSDRIPVISPEQSAALVAGMQEIGMVDADGWLLGDPDTNKPTSLNTSSPAYKWVPRLRAALPWLRPNSRTMSLAYRTSLIQQALNVAWARHDAVADYLTVCLRWLEQRGEADLSELLDKYTVPNGNLTALTIRGLDDGQGSDSSGSAEGPAAGPAEPGTAAGAPAPAPADASSAAPKTAPVPGPATLDALAAQVSEAQRLVGQLAAAGVALNRADLAPVAAVQTALAKMDGGGQQVAAASIQSDLGAATLGDALVEVLGRLQALVAQLREQHAQ